uniref:Uncharacterized protein n=1 Tax=Sphaeramia orbicularis TaxID=375764 RepID=A0A673CPU0_9TELE
LSKINALAISFPLSINIRMSKPVEVEKVGADSPLESTGKMINPFPLSPTLSSSKVSVIMWLCVCVCVCVCVFLNCCMSIHMSTPIFEHLLSPNHIITF